MNNIKIAEVCLGIHLYSCLYVNLKNMPGRLFTALHHVVAINVS